MASAADAGARAEHSGRLLLRMPRTLHAELARRAETEGVSLNQLIVGALSRSVGAPEAPVAPASPRDDTVSTNSAPTAAAPIVASPLRAALVANLVVVAIAAIAAIVLLLVAWHRGF